jgi:hypothetical protein
MKRPHIIVLLESKEQRYDLIIDKYHYLSLTHTHTNKHTHQISLLCGHCWCGPTKVREVT